MSRCSSRVFTVSGRVGLVDDGNTFGIPHTLVEFEKIQGLRKYKV